MSPFYVTFGFSSKLPLWVEDDDDAGTKNNSHADNLAKIRHTQRVAQKTLANNCEDKRQHAINQDDSDINFLSFETGDLVWVKVNMKLVPNPKLAPDGEPG